MKNIVCVKWGDKYSSKEVNQLFFMVKKNLSYSFNFYCLTDDNRGLVSHIKTLPIEEKEIYGWWLKLLLFKKNFFDLKGDVLYLDLDVVIVNKLDSFFDYSPKTPFVISKDWSYPQTKYDGFNSSIFRLKLGDLSYVWDIFYINHKKAEFLLHGDQDWLDLLVKEKLFFPTPWVVPFKSKVCDSKGGSSYGNIGEFLRKKRLFPAPRGYSSIPKDSKVIIFNGKPDPKDVCNSNFLHWKKSPWIKEAWGSESISNQYYK